MAIPGSIGDRIRASLVGTVAVLGVTLSVTACGTASAPKSSGAVGRPAAQHQRRVVTVVAAVPFVHVSAEVTGECQTTADAVGYAVPCPELLPAGMSPTEPVHGCRFAFVAEVGWAGCSDVRPDGWFFGSSDVGGKNAGAAGFQHFVVFGAPRVVRQPARAIDGPAVYPQGVQSRGKLQIKGKTMRWYFVPPDNPSAFRGHLVLVWTQNGHTYSYGFHITGTTGAARALDLEVLEHLNIVSPR